MAKFSGCDAVGDAVGDKFGKLKEIVRTDTTTLRIRQWVTRTTPRLPRAMADYLLDKVPIVHWLPRYHGSWLVQDLLAGLTVGVMLIPQGLAYAKIATIPIENGLYSSWLPAAICVFMGTSKDISTGPTSILGLLTAEIIAELKAEYEPGLIASAVAFMLGLYSLALGLLGLGFMLDYVSVPVLTGFISATALTIGSGQLANLVGLDGAPAGVFPVLVSVIRRVADWDGPTCAVGFGSIAVLVGLEKTAEVCGRDRFAFQYVASSRAIVVLVVFTLISFLVNRGREEAVWAVTEVRTNGIRAPAAHDSSLLSAVAARAIAPLIACTLEHLAVGKAFGRRNGYAIDQSQELSYVGVTNLINSFFGAMPVGGAMSRTAVNSECGVRSPLSGTVTAAFLLLTVYVLSPALYWLPKSALSAIIIMAVVHLFGPVSVFYRYWRVSLADFVASMLSFWLTIFVSAEMGIELATGWGVVWTMVRLAFVRPAVRTGGEGLRPWAGPLHPRSIPDDTVLVRFTDALFYPNAASCRRAGVEAVKLLYDRSGGADDVEPRPPSWSVTASRRVERLRLERGVVPTGARLAVLVLDLSAVPFIDMTGMLALRELQQDVRRHCGDVQFRLVGLADDVRERLLRGGWTLVDMHAWLEEGARGEVVCASVQEAVMHRRGRSEGVDEKQASGEVGKSCSQQLPTICG